MAVDIDIESDIGIDIESDIDIDIGIDIGAAALLGGASATCLHADAATAMASTGTIIRPESVFISLA